VAEDPFAPRPDANVEDRRGEFSSWQHLLMYLGVPPVDHTENAKQGFPPGNFDVWDYLEENPEGPSDLNPPTRLQKAAGFLDLVPPRRK